MEIDRAKDSAARRAVESVRPGMHLALGTGSTTAFAVRAIAERFPNREVDCVATSTATEELARSLGLAVRALRAEDRFDLIIDGADEVSPALDLTKGGGGALFREKLLAILSKQVVIIVDPSKLVAHLGEHRPIPVEVVPYAKDVLAHHFAAEGYRVRLRVRPGGEPFVTDNGNELLDLTPPAPVENPARVDSDLRDPIGVVETGLFVGMTDRVIIGHPDGTVEERERSPRRAR